jgi:TRAP-type transport system periplasmic protein
MKMTRLTLAAAAAFAFAGAASAQTVLKMGYAVPKDSHYGVGATVFCDEIEKGTAAATSASTSPVRRWAASAR